MNRAILILVPTAYSLLMRALLATCRVRRHGTEHLDKLRAQQQTWIYSAWHDNTALAVWAERNQRLAMMASASSDGELIARGIEAFGNHPVRGSTSARGNQAAREMIKALRQGRGAALTPDGPRGPRHVLQPGALWIAALSRCPLVPYHIEADRQWTFKSWDRHKLPKPFATVHICVGAPFTVNRELLQRDEAGLTAQFQASMDDNTAACLALAAGRRDRAAA